jgi:hypothetical protein
MPEFDEARALALAAWPLSCIDRPHDPPSASHYLYNVDASARLIDRYRERRAFFGCYDWHSAVHALWSMAAILHRFPNIPVAGLIREKLEDHLSEQAIAGEVEFFETAGNFEVPYGRAWLLKLYAELTATEWAENLKPLATKFAAHLGEYFTELPVANRTGLHANSAYSMSLALDYQPLRQSISATARRFFANDAACPLAYEPSPHDFLSPSLEEAKLMSQVLPQAEFIAWFDRFLPASPPQPFVTPSAESHLIGLNFSRAEALLQCAHALPSADPRAAAYRQLAEAHAAQGWRGLSRTGYAGSHWLGTFALRYELASTAPLGPRKTHRDPT